MVVSNGDPVHNYCPRNHLISLEEKRSIQREMDQFHLTFSPFYFFNDHCIQLFFIKNMKSAFFNIEITQIWIKVKNLKIYDTLPSQILSVIYMPNSEHIG